MGRQRMPTAHCLHQAPPCHCHLPTNPWQLVTPAVAAASAPVWPPNSTNRSALPLVGVYCVYPNRKRGKGDMPRTGSWRHCRDCRSNSLQGCGRAPRALATFHNLTWINTSPVKATWRPIAAGSPAVADGAQCLFHRACETKRQYKEGSCAGCP